MVSGRGHPPRRGQWLLAASLPPSVSPQSPTLRYLGAALNYMPPAWHQWASLKEQGARCGTNAISTTGWASKASH